MFQNGGFVGLCQELLRGQRPNTLPSLDTASTSHAARQLSDCISDWEKKNLGNPSFRRLTSQAALTDSVLTLEKLAPLVPLVTQQEREHLGKTLLADLAQQSTHYSQSLSLLARVTRVVCENPDLGAIPTPFRDSLGQQAVYPFRQAVLLKVSTELFSLNTLSDASAIVSGEFFRNVRHLAAQENQALNCLGRIATVVSRNGISQLQALEAIQKQAGKFWTPSLHSLTLLLTDLRMVSEKPGPYFDALSKYIRKSGIAFWQSLTLEQATELDSESRRTGLTTLTAPEESRPALATHWIAQASKLASLPSPMTLYTLVQSFPVPENGQNVVRTFLAKSANSFSTMTAPELAAWLSVSLKKTANPATFLETVDLAPFVSRLTNLSDEASARVNEVDDVTARGFCLLLSLLSEDKTPGKSAIPQRYTTDLRDALHSLTTVFNAKPKSFSPKHLAQIIVAYSRLKLDTPTLDFPVPTLHTLFPQEDNFASSAHAAIAYASSHPLIKREKELLKVWIEEGLSDPNLVVLLPKEYALSLARLGASGGVYSPTLVCRLLCLVLQKSPIDIGRTVETTLLAKQVFRLLGDSNYPLAAKVPQNSPAGFLSFSPALLTSRARTLTAIVTGARQDLLESEEVTPHDLIEMKTLVAHELTYLLWWINNAPKNPKATEIASSIVGAGISAIVDSKHERFSTHKPVRNDTGGTIWVESSSGFAIWNRLRSLPNHS